MAFVNEAPRWAFIAGMALLASCGRSDNAESESSSVPVIEGNSFAIENVRVFDGRDVVESATVVVTGGRIVSVGDLPAPAGVQTIDGAGKTLLPGLIDAHVHAFDQSTLRDALRFGVTTELDMFTAINFAAGRRAVRDNLDRTDMADLYSAGTLVTSEGGHGTQFGLPIATIADPSAAGEFVRDRLGEGSDYIKIVYEPDNPVVTSISKETLIAVIAAAKDQGALSVVHISSLAAARDAVEAGAGGLAHIFADAPIDENLIAAMQANGVFVIPTLSIIASAADRGLGSSLGEDEALRPYLSVMQQDGLGVSFSSGRDVSDRFNLDIAKENVRRLHEAGVPILAGTDAPNPGTAYGVSMHGELELLIRAGLTPIEALNAATAANAEAFGLGGRGTIAPSTRADLLLVDGDPTTDIVATRRVARIFKNGFEVVRERQDTKQAAVEKPVLMDGQVSRFEEDLSSGFGVVWTATTDQLANGKSTAALSNMKPGAEDSVGALRVDGEISTKFFFPWSGAGIFFSEGFAVPVDLSSYKTISFSARGDEREPSLLLFTRTSRQRPATKTFGVTTDWRRHEIDLTTIRGAALGEVYGFAVTAGRPNGEFHFEIDEIRLE